MARASPRSWVRPMRDAATIRLAVPSDAAEIHAIYTPVVRETVISFEIDPPSEAEMAARIARCAEEERPWLVLVRNDRIEGYAYATTHRSRAAYRWTVESSVFVAQGARGKGVGRALYRALLALLDIQGYATVLAGIALPNAASIALHESVGFRPAGVFASVGHKLDEWRDVGWWSCTLGAAGRSPGPPLTLAEATATDAWRRALEDATG